jgi:hypothetical protein
MLRNKLVHSGLVSQVTCLISQQGTTSSLSEKKHAFTLVQVHSGSETSSTVVQRETKPMVSFHNKEQLQESRVRRNKPLSWWGGLKATCLIALEGITCDFKFHFTTRNNFKCEKKQAFKLVGWSQSHMFDCTRRNNFTEE